MDICLVNMPWAALDRPSLALGVLEAQLLQHAPQHQVVQVHANLRFAEYLHEATGGRVSPAHYEQISNRYMAGAGEWIFSGALYGQPEWRYEDFAVILAGTGDLDPEDMGLIHRLVPAFVQGLAADILASGPQLVGLTSTFMQNIPSLSLARELKAQAPDVLICLGGANCDGVQGRALHRNFPFLDFVVCGEGDVAFVELVELLSSDDRSGISQIPGLCWRDADSRLMVNSQSTRPVAPGRLVPPAYDGYFAELRASKVRSWIEPQLVLEASRGCWWGAKHQCTFCGLNGSYIEYRSKAGKSFCDELNEVVSRYHCLDVILADNILDTRYFEDFLPAVADLGWDLRMHCEIKSNLNLRQLIALADSGMVSIQPGIESLSSRILALMRKGVNGAQNVRVLRDAESLGLTVHWNYLFGFPGEDNEDYLPVLSQFPALHHLQPPTWAMRIALERFSPYFDDMSLGVENLGPADVYRVAYDLPDTELQDLVYIFKSRVRGGISNEVEEALVAGVAEWESAYKNSWLTMDKVGDDIVVWDQRCAWLHERLAFRVGSVPARVLIALRRPQTIKSLEQQLQQSGPPSGTDDVRDVLVRFLSQGLVFKDGDRYIALPVAADPTEFERVPQPSAGVRNVVAGEALLMRSESSNG
jgi:ribosomal peptide maturation radical SAM protein 1